MKEYLTKNWKNILLVLLVVFSLGKCTQSCNRDGEIKKLSTQIEKSDSIYNDQNKTLVIERDSLSRSLDIANKEIESLNKMVETLQKSNSTLSDVAKKETKVQIVRGK